MTKERYRSGGRVMIQGLIDEFASLNGQRGTIMRPFEGDLDAVWITPDDPSAFVKAQHSGAFYTRHLVLLHDPGSEPVENP